MSYEATVFSVMIASPSDVVAERNIVRELVNEWNYVSSFSRKVVLQPVGWETHSSPAMGKHPQHILNEQILDRCDLLVGVFWTRIGTQTDKFESGSVEEIERHISAGKPAMLYFSDAPVRLDSVDGSQYERLMAFKHSCAARGLFVSFSDHADFRDKFYRQLQLKLNEDAYFSPSPQIEGDSTVPLSSRVPIVHLSKEASVLLKEAAQDGSGSIMHIRHMGGVDIQTNGKAFVTDRDRRTVAIWEAALNELEEQKLIVARGTKGQLFEVTKAGYDLAEIIAV